MIALKITTTKSTTSEKIRSHKAESKARKPTLRKSGGPDFPGRGLSESDPVKRLLESQMNGADSGASTKRRGNMNARENVLLDNPTEVQDDVFTRKAAVIPCDQDAVIVDWSSGVLKSNVQECRDGRKTDKVNSREEEILGKYFVLPPGTTIIIIESA